MKNKKAIMPETVTQLVVAVIIITLMIVMVILWKGYLGGG
tara:strand:+ start:316 stop:435 length:120 start_codon:yes stop_codon:yes gene_type:complete